MVCLGNICRSPVAEGILRQKAKERKLNILTDSAGTSAFHIGEKPDNRMILIAKRNGVDISDLRARQIQVGDFEEFDLIFAMDRDNYLNTLALTQNELQRKKVKLILNESNPGSDNEVPDPYFGGDEGFQHVIDILNPAIDKLISRMDV